MSDPLSISLNRTKRKLEESEQKPESNLSENNHKEVPRYVKRSRPKQPPKNPISEKPNKTEPKIEKISDLTKSHKIALDRIEKNSIIQKMLQKDIEKVEKKFEKGMKLHTKTVNKEEEKNLLKLKTSQRISIMLKMNNEELFDALIEVMAMGDFKREGTFEMINIMPKALQEKISSFCKAIQQDEEKIAFAFNRKNGIKINVNGKENDKNMDTINVDKNMDTINVNGKEKDKNMYKNMDKNMDKNIDKNIDKNELKGVEKWEKEFSMVDDDEVFVEATIESMTCYKQEKEISNKMIIEFIDAASMIDELWKRVNWIGNYRIGSENDFEDEKAILEEIDKMKKVIESDL